MHNHWLDLLSSTNATFNKEQLCIFNDAKPTLDNSLIPLSQYGLLEISGVDAEKFLQGQTSCDFRAISLDTSKYGSYCTPKGRMLTSFLASKTADNRFILRMSRDLIEDTAQILSKYGVFFKSTINDVSTDYYPIGVIGTMASRVIEKTLGQCPNDYLKTISINNHTIIQLDHEGCQFECWINKPQASQYWHQFSQQLQLTNTEAWALSNIRQGIGQVTRATKDEFIPQMFNFQQLDAISFNKGCYTGQEVIARMQYKGNLKKRLYRLELKTKDIINIGDTLNTTDSTQSVGQVVAAAHNEQQQWEILAVITHDAVKSQQLIVSQPEGKQRTTCSFKLLNLPYEMS